MIDREKVKLGIKACWSEYFSHKCYDCPYMSDRNDRKCVERLGDDALALLKEWEAVHPICTGGYMHLETPFVCPECGEPVFDDARFCSGCGKPVLWEGRCSDDSD